MRFVRWLGLAWVICALATITGCTGILGDFDVSTSNEDGGGDASLSGLDANSSVDGTVGVDGNGGGNDAGADTSSPIDAGGDGPTCAANQKACNGGCVPNDSIDHGCNDPNSCSPCGFANAVPASICIGGACALDHCLNGYQDCNSVASDGCEIHTAADPSHCGSCIAQCSDAGGTPSCSGGTCSSIACDPGYADCNHDPKDGCEIHTGGDPNNCGTCGYVCGTANGTPSCNEADDAGTAQCVFACNAPYAHCPSSADKSGCDVNTNTDNANCGKCGNACALGTTCINGSCTCNAQTCPSGCCDSTGACVTATNAACGKSGAACAACATGQECNATTGKCECNATSCPNGCCDATSGQCVTTASNAQCGKSGSACAACGTGTVCSTDGTKCTCTAASCPNGCCNGDACIPIGAGQNASQCGANGDACGTCAVGQGCSNGTCSCGGASCTGCCNSGTCVAGTANNQCGSSGSVCATCAADQECNAQGKCVCDAKTCPNGCCDSSGHCQNAEGQTTCGKAGVACATCGTGQECNATTGTCACDATSCPSGCCNGATCVPYANETQAACGTGGATCGACAQGQRCNGAGKCVCDATSCPNGCCDSSGQCQASGNGTCGTGGVACAICATGQECVSGACKCDANSCGHGCCSGNTCVTTESSAACGTGGASCATCATGQECNGTACVCDATSCANGCCNGNTCVPYASENNASCGTGGAKCTACVTGQECSSSTHTCACDPTSCPNGCCNGNTCVPYASETTSTCGFGGASCAACPAGQGCNTSTGKCGCTGASCPSGCCATDGTCNTSGNTTCGVNGAACANCTSKGEECVNGTCKCDATSCPNGCCDVNGVCQTSGTSTCGVGGAACKSCGAGQTCSASGACQCDPACTGCCSGGPTGSCVAGTSVAACGTGGTGTCATCASGQECAQAGGKYSCTCDATSCAGGCCDTNNQCHASSTSTCGLKGASCQTCNTNAGQECSSGQCVCDATSCPSGCCTATTNGQCITTETSGQCGPNGGICGTCPNGTFVCTNGACACPVGDTNCSNVCVNTATDPNNCGGCSGAGGATCINGQTCQGGKCACPANTTNCGAAAPNCVDESSDPLNCGACGHSCGGGQCVSGKCQPFTICTYGAAGGGYSPELALDNGTAYWNWNVGGSSGAIVACPLSARNTTVTPLYSIGFGPVGNAGDGTNIYWTDENAGQIQTAPESGAGPVQTIITGLSNPVGIRTISPGGNKGLMYATGSTVMMRILVNPGPVTCISGLGFPYFIGAFNLNVYAADLGSNQIVGNTFTASTCGTQFPVATGVSGPQLALTDGSAVYFGTRGTSASGYADGAIYACPLTGCSPVASPPKYYVTGFVSSMSVDGSNLIASTQNMGIFRCAKSGGCAPVTLVPNVQTYAMRANAGFVYYVNGNTLYGVAE